jgi:hypothetical protein
MEPLPRGRTRAASTIIILVVLLLLLLCWGAVPARAVVGAGPSSLFSLFSSWQAAYHYVRFVTLPPSILFLKNME